MKTKFINFTRKTAFRTAAIPMFGSKMVDGPFKAEKNQSNLTSLILLLAIVFSTQSLLAADSAPGTTRPPAAGSAGSAPAPGPEIKPIGGGTVVLGPINAPPVKREDAPGNKPK